MSMRLSEEKKEKQALRRNKLIKNIAFLNSITNAIHIETSNLLPDEVANYIIGIISK